MFALLLLIVVSCKETNAQKTQDIETMENKTNFGWSATITNPDGYAVEIHEGYIADDKQPIASFVNIGKKVGKGSRKKILQTKPIYINFVNGLFVCYCF